MATTGAESSPVQWTDAVSAAQELRERCRLVTRVVDRYESFEQARACTEEWALPLYAAAAETGQAPAMVSAAELRYRLGQDVDRFAIWLGAQLQRVGHRVTQPMAPAVYGPASDLAAVTTVLAAAVTAQRSDDPPRRVWLRLSPITSGTSETSDGTVVQLRMHSQLWTLRTTMITMLDAVLVLERGGWPAGTRVRHHRGVPDYLSPEGRLSTEVGVSGDRAVVDSPEWAVDDTGRTLVDGPPTGYLVQYRNLRTGLGSVAHRSPAPIPADHLVADTGPRPGSPPQTADRTGRRRLFHARGPVPDPHRVTLTRSAGLDPDNVTTQPEDRPEEPENLPGHDRGPLEAADGPFRQAAIARLWHLRDLELEHGGDSTPLRIAERIVAGTIPPPVPPPTSRELAAQENLAQLGQVRAIRNAPGAVFDRQLITGKRRELLLEWLPQVCERAYTTTRQRTVLDGFDADPTTDAVQTMMITEGFEEIAQLTGLHSAGATGGSDGDVDLVWAHWELGLIAFSHAPNFGTGPKPAYIRVAGVVEALDHELLTAAWRGATPVFDDQHRRTHVCTGQIQRTLSGRGDDGSLRVTLAAIRAFSRPMLPWPATAWITFGRDSASPDERRRAIAALPRDVHDVFGPHLLASVP